MILRIDHVALAVRDYEKAYNFFSDLFSLVPGSYSVDNNLKYRWQLFTMGDLSRFEILNPTGEGSFLDNFLQDREGGIHHITLQTQDIKKAVEILKEKKIPYFGFREYGNLWKEVFIHPRNAFGVLIQIAEFRPDDWLPPSGTMTAGEKYEIEKTETGCTLTFSHPGGGKTNVSFTREEAKRLARDLADSL